MINLDSEAIFYNLHKSKVVMNKVILEAAHIRPGLIRGCIQHYGGLTKRKDWRNDKDNGFALVRFE